MAGRRARRGGRALRVVVALGVAAVALGAGNPPALVAHDATAPHRLDVVNQALLDAAASFPAQLDTRRLRLVAPGGRGPAVIAPPAAPVAPVASAAAPARTSSAPSASAAPSRPRTPPGA